MGNPFSVIDEKLSGLEGLLLELCNKLQDAVVSGSQEKPLNIEEASAFLNRSVPSIYNLTSRREIPFHKKGKHLSFYKSELNDWVKEGRQLTLSAIQTETRKGVRRG